MIGTIVFGVFLLLAIGIPLLLWAAIEQETANPQLTDRESAERFAKARGGLRGEETHSHSSSQASAESSTDRPSGRESASNTEYSVFDDEGDDDRRDRY